MESEHSQQQKKVQQSLIQVEEIIQSLSSQIRYIKVFPWSKPKISQYAPHVLTYEDNDQLFVSDLVKKYASVTDREEAQVYFKLESGYVMKKSKTIKEIKKQLRLDSLDGLEVYVQSLLLYFDQNYGFTQSKIIDKSNFNKKVVDIEFVLPDIKYSIYLPVEGGNTQKNNMQADYQSVTIRLSAEIQRIFGKYVNPKDITLSYDQKWTQLNNNKIRFQKLYLDDKVKVSFKDKLVLPPPPRENNTFLIIQGEGIKQNKSHYDDIKDKKLKDLLNQIDPRPKWGEYGLKIGDFVLKPEEKISKAHYLMKNQNQNWKYFLGFIINESQMFEAEQDKIKKIGKFDIQEVVDKTQANLHLLKFCYKMIQKRAKNTTNAYFKDNIESIKPIFLYKSQLQVQPSLKRSSVPIYRHLNVFLRNQSFGQTTDDQYQQIWEYRFISNLLQQLRHIQPITNRVLYRGANFISNYEVGDTILYKQFFSTIPIQQVAKQFANKVLFKITKSHSGKSIKEFSYFQTEDQVLFEPYCQFKVTEISTIVNEMIGNISIPLIEIEEIKKAPLPDSPTWFLLWIDDKTIVAHDTWESLTNIKKNSVMIPLLSTEELKDWLNTHETLLNDKTAEFVMVTNMVRVEKGVRNQQAGVEAIKEFKRFRSEGHILVYIGWVEGTIQKLEKHNLIAPNNNNKIEVTNDENELKNFLKAYGGLF